MSKTKTKNKRSAELYYTFPEIDERVIHALATAPKFYSGDLQIAIREEVDRRVMAAINSGESVEPDIMTKVENDFKDREMWRQLGIIAPGDEKADGPID